MKKIFGSVLLAALLAVGLAACGDNEAQTVDNVSAPQSSTSEEPEEIKTAADGKTLVAVFSRVPNSDIDDDVDVTSGASLNKTDAGIKGDTEMMAQVAVDATGGDLFEIVVDKPYSADEEKVYDQAKQEQLDQARPALKTKVENMDKYSTIVLIYPNWWGSIPMPVATFLEEYDLSKKTILPVCCYDAEDDGAGNSRADIQALVKGYVTNAYSVRGSGGATSGTRTDFTSWLQKMPVNY
ncbi:MAG: flavodoxin [Peptococcaceae bacterium]|nr:flavodoxin [Peptococcaceae bacterium]